ncbi:hypothetical protein N9I84_06005 [Gammaproteobacteria bacterium]|nr:hypothetical protein [Gammaproteobacteria bacterium]
MTRKAIILAADNYPKANEFQMPSCFALTIGSISLIEYQIRILNLLGYKYADITVVTGNSGVWENESLSNIIFENKIKELKIENSNYRSFFSLKSYFSMSKKINNLLIVNGDSFFELKDLERLIYPQNTSKILVESKNNSHGNGLEVFSEKSIVTKIENEIMHSHVPWDAFYGSIYLSSDAVFAIDRYLSSTFKFVNSSYLEVLVNEADIKLTKIDVHKTNSGLQGTSDKTLELVGGSFAGLHKMTLVKKYSDSEGNDKLVAELNWLNNLPNNVKNKFISVVDYKIGDKQSWFTMPWYDLENLRKKIISGKFSTDKTLHYIEKILDYAFENLYINIIGKADDNWIYEKHFNRVFERFNKIENIKPFNNILKCKKIKINGQEYRNLPLLVSKLKEFELKNNFFQPENLVMVHGDLHFQNMLIDSENDDFILADPRGEENGSDIYYDMGKLWHSINGLYDLIHTDISRANILKINKEEVHIDLHMGGFELLNLYADLKDKTTKLIQKYPLANEKHWLLKTKFAEAMHFSSLMYFHLKHDGIENRALCIYCQAIILTTELLNELEEI